MLGLFRMRFWKDIGKNENQGPEKQKEAFKKASALYKVSFGRTSIHGRSCISFPWLLVPELLMKIPTIHFENSLLETSVEELQKLADNLLV